MKIEVFAFVAGIVVFFALLGSFYFLLDNKAFSTEQSAVTPSPTGDKLQVLGKEDGIQPIPPNEAQQKAQAEAQQQQAPPPTTVPKKKEAPKMTINPEKKYTATFETSEGEIEIELNAEKAPQTVNNFVYLVRTDYYDNTTFHRVLKDFMIQGGDPKGDGTGGPGYTVPAEIKDDLKHEKGAISMARLGDDVNPEKASSGSQFFIMHKTTPQLDGDYTVFGKVTKGLDVVDKIAAKEVKDSASGEKSKPVSPVKVTNITIQEEDVEKSESEKDT